MWRVSHKADPVGAKLADGHYSRRTVGAPQFMPPGEVVVLVRSDAVFGWWRPDPRSGLKSMNGLDGWTCSIFRNVGVELSSTLILAAESALVAQPSPSGFPPGPDGMLTYVYDRKVRSPNPGYCFKLAGWHVAGSRACCARIAPRSRDGRKTLLHKPIHGAGSALYL